jgi:hypothetical protein
MEASSHKLRTYRTFKSFVQVALLSTVGACCVVCALHTVLCVEITKLASPILVRVVIGLTG